MNRRYTRRSMALLLVLALLVSMLGAALPVSKIGCRFRHLCDCLIRFVGESPGGAGGFRA